MARTAGELMTAPAVTVTPAATTGQAARIMSRHRVGRLPVRDPLTGRLGVIQVDDHLGYDIDDLYPVMLASF